MTNPSTPSQCSILKEISRESSHPVYMDYSATTPVDPRVAEKMIPYLCEKFGNPASNSHMYGWEAEAAVEEARSQVAALINADPREIVWTSGATEANNLALKGAASFTRQRASTSSLSRRNINPFWIRSANWNAKVSKPLISTRRKTA